MRKNSRKGFTLVEVVVAFSLIAVVFAVAMSAVLFSFNVRRRTDNAKFFIGEVEQYLECYKIGGSAEFESNTNKYVTASFAKSNPTDGDAESGTVYKIYYTKAYKIVGEKTADENAAFVLEVTLNKSFSAKVTEYKSGKAIYALKEPFVSHFDM